jgi:hypothetical protein
MLSKLQRELYTRLAAPSANLRIETTGPVQRASSAPAMLVTGMIWARKSISEIERHDGKI